MSARYQRLVEEDQHLPSGMHRVGYDADTQTYTYQDSEGLWETEEGQEYGVLHRAGSQRRPLSPAQQAEHQSLLQEQNRAAWRYLLPFLLLVGLFLLAVFRIVRGGGLFAGHEKPSVVCEGVHDEAYTIVRGDTCWDIAERFGIEVDLLKEQNRGLDCQRLRVGEAICVPQEGDRVSGK